MKTLVVLFYKTIKIFIHEKYLQWMNIFFNRFDQMNKIFNTFRKEKTVRYLSMQFNLNQCKKIHIQINILH